MRTIVTNSAATVQVCDAIRQINTREELNVVSSALRERWNSLGRLEARSAAAQFNMGDKVEWDSRKRFGSRMEGTIIGFGPKNVMVRTSQGDWRVHPTFLRKVS